MYQVIPPSSCETQMGWLRRYEKELERDGGRGRRSGAWTTNYGSGRNIALNGCLGVRKSRNMRRGMGDKLASLALSFDRHNLLLNGWRSGNVFFRLLFEFNHLQCRANKDAVKPLFHIWHETARAVQVPTTGHQVLVWKFQTLHGRKHTKIGVDIDPI